MEYFLITTAAPVARVARIHLRGFGSDVCLRLEKDVLAHEHSCHQYIQKKIPALLSQSEFRTGHGPAWSPGEYSSVCAAAGNNC